MDTDLTSSEYTPHAIGSIGNPSSEGSSHIGMARSENLTRSLEGVVNDLERSQIPALMKDGYRVTCCVELENCTKFTLTAPMITLVSGRVSFLPPTMEIKPGQRTVMVFRKRCWLHGTHGTLSWLIKEAERRLVVMWSVPYFLSLYSNTLALGLTEPDQTQHQPPGERWFDEMYRGPQNDCSLRFMRREYFRDIRPLVYRDVGLVIEGSMSDGHKAHVKIVFRETSSTEE